MATFLQWNCRSYYANFEKLVCLIGECTPKCICLQELRLCSKNLFPPSAYDTVIVSTEKGDNGRGGAAILLHKSVPHTPIPLRTTLHAAATRIHLGCDYTVCSLYLAPSTPVTKMDLDDLFRQLPSPVVVLGDFNIRHPLWGDSITSPNANILVDLLPKYSLGCLNSGLPTFERLDQRSSSCIDVTLCSVSILDHFRWSRFDFLYGSDHYPFSLHGKHPSPAPSPYTSWRYQRADWASFYRDTSIPWGPSPDMFPTTDEAFNFFAAVVLSAAEAHIPRSSTGKRPAAPWWSADCSQMDREKKKLFKLYKKNPTEYNLVAYKTAAAKSRRTNRRTRRQYFRNYASTVNESTPLSSVWRVVDKLSRRSNSSPPIVLRYGDNLSDVIAAPAVVADTLGYAFSCSSSSTRYTPEFQAIRNNTRISASDFVAPKESQNLPYNHLFTLDEFRTALASCKDGAVGPDGLSYIMLRKLHQSASAFLLNLYNRIWVENSFPALWFTAHVVPVPKPIKIHIW